MLHICGSRKACRTADWSKHRAVGLCTRGNLGVVLLCYASRVSTVRADGEKNSCVLTLVFILHVPDSVTAQAVYAIIVWAERGKVYSTSSCGLWL